MANYVGHPVALYQGLNLTVGQKVRVIVSKLNVTAIALVPVSIPRQVEAPAELAPILVSTRNFATRDNISVSSIKTGHDPLALVDGISGVPFRFSDNDPMPAVAVANPGPFTIAAVLGYGDAQDTFYLEFSSDAFATVARTLAFPALRGATYLLIDPPNGFPHVRFRFPRGYAGPVGEIWLGTYRQPRRMYKWGFERTTQWIGREIVSEYGAVDFRALSRRLKFRLPYTSTEDDRAMWDDVFRESKGRYVLWVLEHQEVYLARMGTEVQFRHRSGNVYEYDLNLETEPLP
jgi:hypothetical protein